MTGLSKAFDCLNHELLIAKLNACAFTLLALKRIHNYLSNRKQRTKINSSCSELWLLKFCKSRNFYFMLYIHVIWSFIFVIYFIFTVYVLLNIYYIFIRILYIFKILLYISIFTLFDFKFVWQRYFHFIYTRKFKKEKFKNFLDIQNCYKVKFLL